MKRVLVLIPLVFGLLAAGILISIGFNIFIRNSDNKNEQVVTHITPAEAVADPLDAHTTFQLRRKETQLVSLFSAAKTSVARRHLNIFKIIRDEKMDPEQARRELRNRLFAVKQTPLLAVFEQCVAAMVRERILEQQIRKIADLLNGRNARSTDVLDALSFDPKRIIDKTLADELDRELAAGVDAEIQRQTALLKAKITQLRAQHARWLKNCEDLKTQIAHLGKTSAQLKTDVAEMQTQKSRLAKDCANARTKHAALTAQATALKSTLGALKKDLSKCFQEWQRMTTRITDLRTQTATAKRDAETAHASAAEAKRAEATAMKRRDEAVASAATAERRIGELKGQATALALKNSQLAVKISQLEKRPAELRKEVTQHRTDLAYLDGEIKTARKVAASLRALVPSISKEVELLQAKKRKFQAETRRWDWRVLLEPGKKHRWTEVGYGWRRNEDGKLVSERVYMDQWGRLFASDGQPAPRGSVKFHSPRMHAKCIELQADAIVDGHYR